MMFKLACLALFAETIVGDIIGAHPLELVLKESNSDNSVESNGIPDIRNYGVDDVDVDDFETSEDVVNGEGLETPYFGNETSGSQPSRLEVRGLFDLRERFRNLIFSDYFNPFESFGDDVYSMFNDNSLMSQILGTDEEFEKLLEESSTDDGSVSINSLMDKDFKKSWDEITKNPELLDALSALTNRQPGAIKNMMKCMWKMVFERKKHYPDCATVRPHFHGVCEDKEKGQTVLKDKYNGEVFRWLRSGYVPAAFASISIGAFGLEKFLCSSRYGVLKGGQSCEKIQHVAYLTEAVSMMFAMYGYRNFNDQESFSRLVLKIKNHAHKWGIQFTDLYAVTTDNQVYELTDTFDTLDTPLKSIVSNYYMDGGQPASIAFYPLNHKNELGYSFISRHFVFEDVYRINNPELPCQRKAEDIIVNGHPFLKVMGRIDCAHLDYHLDHPSPQQVRAHLANHIFDIFDFIFNRGQSGASAYEIKLNPSDCMSEHSGQVGGSGSDSETRFGKRSIGERIRNRFRKTKPQVEPTEEETESQEESVESVESAEPIESINPNEEFEEVEQVIRGGFHGIKLRMTYELDPVHNLAYWDGDHPDYM